jgi:hypothetical protein
MRPSYCLCVHLSTFESVKRFLRNVVRTLQSSVLELDAVTSVPDGGGKNSVRYVGNSFHTYTTYRARKNLIAFNLRESFRFYLV